jgi:hypothetical protein
MSQDREFEKYLQGSSALSQLYAELPDAKLPAHLDAAILAEAHRAVSSRPGAKPKRRWTIPLGLVATLFVAVMIGLQVPHMLKEAASPQQRQEEKMAVMMDTGAAGRPSDAIEPEKKIQKWASVRPQEKSEIILAEPAMEAAEVVAPVRSSASVVVSPQKSVTSERKFSNRALNAPAAMLAAPASLAAKPLDISVSGFIEQGKVLAKEKNASGLLQDKQSYALEQQAPAAAMITAPQPLQLKRALKDETSETTSSPEDWLKRIKRLTIDGKLDEAKKELTAFKKNYPGYPISAALEIR